MKRKTFTILFTAVIFSVSMFFSGNELKAQEDGGFRLGLKGGMNLGWLKSNADFLESDGVYPGFSWGAIGESFFAPNYAFSTGINIHFFKGGLKSDMMGNIEADEFKGKGNVTAKMYLKYLEIPLLAKMKTNNLFEGFSFYGNIGLAPSFRLDAKASFNDGDKVKMNDETHLLKLSMIVGIGTEYDLDSNTTLFAGLNFNNGLTNVFKKDKFDYADDFSAASNFVELSVGIFF